jgi:hypothetical protein
MVVYIACPNLCDEGSFILQNEGYMGIIKDRSLNEFKLGRSGDVFNIEIASDFTLFFQRHDAGKAWSYLSSG